MDHSDFQKEIKALLLDDAFLFEFVQRIQGILSVLSKNKNAVMVNPDELELFFEVSPTDNKAFLINAKEVYSDNPEITVFDQAGLMSEPAKPYPVTEDIKKIIIDGLRYHKRGNNCACYAGLRPKTEASAQQKETGEVTNGETSREQ